MTVASTLEACHSSRRSLPGSKKSITFLPENNLSESNTRRGSTATSSWVTRLSLVGANIWRRRSRAKTTPNLPASQNTLDDDTQNQLRKFCQRNRAATDRIVAEIERRESVVARMLEKSFTKQVIETVSEDENDPDAVLSLDANEAEEEKRKSTSASSLSELKDCSDYTLCQKNRNALVRRHTGPAFQASNSVFDDGQWSNSAAVITGFATRRGSEEDVHSLIRSYDIFEPDMRSTRYSEFCRLLQNDRADFDAYVRRNERIRGKHRAATVPPHSQRIPRK